MQGLSEGSLGYLDRLPAFRGPAPEGPVIPRSRRNLFSFGDNDNAGTKAGKSKADGALDAKEELGWGGGAHRGKGRGPGLYESEWSFSHDRDSMVDPEGLVLNAPSWTRGIPGRVK